MSSNLRKLAAGFLISRFCFPSGFKSGGPIQSINSYCWKLAVYLDILTICIRRDCSIRKRSSLFPQRAMLPRLINRKSYDRFKLAFV